MAQELDLKQTMNGQYIDDETLSDWTLLLQRLADWHLAEVEKDRIKTITKLMGVKTEGLFDNGDLFIKRSPIEQEIINLVGYDAFKAIQEAVDAQPRTQSGEGK